MRSARGWAIGAVGCAALAIALVPGCGNKAKSPTGVVGRLAPKVEAAFPAPRSAGVMYDTAIWVQFAEPLDPATIDERTVFLKLDTIRQPVTLAYDSLTRRIRLQPRVVLQLRRTYTIEITPSVKTESGGALDQTYFWQFGTNSLRRPFPAAPDSGATFESPYVQLRWAATETSAGTIAYDVYAGPDSAAVANRGVPIRSRAAQDHHIPDSRWALGSRFYWAITAVNTTTGERLAGPVWRFTTLPSGTPIDSLVVGGVDWGYYCPACSNHLVCNAVQFAAGPSYTNGLHFRLHEAAGSLKLAGARLRLNTSSFGDLSGYQAAVYPALEPWLPCSYTVVTPRVDRVDLAFAVQEPGTQILRFESDHFTAHLEAVARTGNVYGYSIRTSNNLGISSPATGTDATRPGLMVYYYRLP
jgi:hypothetical protein